MAARAWFQLGPGGHVGVYRRRQIPVVCFEMICTLVEIIVPGDGGVLDDQIGLFGAHLLLIFCHDF